MIDRQCFRLLMAVALFLVGVPAVQAADLIGLYLTWSQDPSTTMTVNWVNLSATDGTAIAYRELKTEPWEVRSGQRSDVGETTMQVRRVELDALKPDTVYEFYLGDESARNPTLYRFRTMPAELTRPVRFVSGGDMMHTREMVDTMNRQAAALDPDFALLGGDLAYANGVNDLRWIDWLQSWTKLCVGKEQRLIPMVLTIGNHEVRSKAPSSAPKDRAPFFYSLFSLPEQRSYYTLDFGKYLSLVILDTDHTQPIAGEQAAWLQAALANRAAQQFLFACYHYPAYGTEKAPKGMLPIDAPKSIAIRSHWMPQLERYGLSAVFENDHHNFKRSHRLRNHQRDDANGLLYLGDGAWGVKTRTVPKPDVAWWLAKAEARNHLWSVDLRTEGTATIRAIDAQGKTFDEVTLSQPRTVPVP